MPAIGHVAAAMQPRGRSFAGARQPGFQAVENACIWRAKFAAAYRPDYSLPVSKNVFILGAGASAPYGFPTSSQLRSIILGGEPGTRTLQTLGVPFHRLLQFFEKQNEFGNMEVRHADALLDHRSDDIPLQIPVANLFLDAVFRGHRATNLAGFRQTFFESQRVSIDAFIAKTPHLAHEAAVAIAAILLLCEREERLEGDWYQQLLEAVFRNLDQFLESDSTFLTFNYDRSFERYFSRAFAIFCGSDMKLRARLADAFTITHAYGTLGPFKRQSDEGIPYGDLGSIDYAKGYVSLARAGAENPKKKVIDAALANAERVTFLGFGFWPENLSLLGFQEIIQRKDVPGLHASAMGLPRSVRMDLEKQIQFGEFKHTVFDYVTQTKALAF